MDKQERENLRRRCEKAIANPKKMCDGESLAVKEVFCTDLLALLDHIDALERNDIRLRNLITRAAGWVEEVKCVSEQAVQEQRSFITELEIAALTQAEETRNG